MGEQRMRVVAGTHRGRRISAPKGDATRPTSDRVREGLFSSLISHVGSLEGMAAIDLYAGSGALGIEALSRGASSAVFVESARPAVSAIKRNLDELGLADRATVIALPVENAHRSIPSSTELSLLFADPPYRISKAKVRASIERLAKAGLVLADATLIWEHAAGESPEWPDSFEPLGTKKYGSTEVSFARYEPTKEA